MCLGEMSTVFPNNRANYVLHTLPSLSFVCTILARCATVAWFQQQRQQSAPSISLQQISSFLLRLRNPFSMFFGFALSFLSKFFNAHCDFVLWLSMPSCSSSAQSATIVCERLIHVLTPWNKSLPLFSPLHLHVCFVLLFFLCLKNILADLHTLSLGV